MGIYQFIAASEPIDYTKGKWCANVVDSILRNEKYTGDALLQKTYITDFLTKKQAKNQGEVAQH